MGLALLRALSLSVSLSLSLSSLSLIPLREEKVLDLAWSFLKAVRDREEKERNKQFAKKV